MYNLLDEKWMIGIKANGEIEPASIRDCILQEFVDVKSFDFHGKHFYLYDYLLIRLLSTIAADVLIHAAKDSPDAYDDTIEQIIARKIKTERDSFKDAAEKYFETYHDRFNLFDKSYPFLQFPQLLRSNDKSLQNNPLAPADSGRIFPESFDAHFRISISETNHLCDGKAVCNYSKEQFVITMPEAAYILLYLSSIAPGIGSGNKSVLAGNAFVFEVLKGSTLYETILLNVPISGYLFDDDDDLIDFGTPVWRWNSIEEQQEKILTTGKIKIMEGMFFPVKRIHLDSKKEKVIVYEEALSKGEKTEIGALVDVLRNLWAKKYEPHALIDQIKSTDTGKPNNPYRKISPGDNLWLLLAATAQTEQTSLQKMKGKKIVDFTQSAGSSHHIQELSNADTLPEQINIRYYYRMADDKWVYFRTGYVDGNLPREILKNPIRQKYLCEMTQYVNEVKDALRKYCKNYLANTSGDPTKKAEDNAFKNVNSSMYEKAFMDSIQSVFVGHHSFLFEICKTEDLDGTYKEWKKFITKNALDQFSCLMDQKRMETFWFYHEQLRRECAQYWKK